ncbi:transcriptional regulator [Rhizobium sp. VS19-DR104.2]|uniref:HVO_A0114 family putative DNA-binding protein n=1 Tax=unclassified Rhizobium TaxID=2613769 RepID=UPI001CC7C30F|nr:MULTISPECIES: transcriptional regulator [unclassified Rhizobium]MBZ5761943.1 transcriptional regulator [Rhizobium sp. VS19-DR96]MBZ5768915.1 transcriptional regulator [Rhizobium sp. VS19-DR129.2]MBZ5775681.1 transcriptional regulator [Rhizobium sp. VS19-DRK62.2]MBZ5786821.1 transcriptional regulator [Rhizobium sp. VS19-DR121]MBZ5805031.1 transcriptional regulator [Rhizobium sp. VS19-DR181]
MRTLIVRLGTMSDAKARFVNAGREALEGSAEPVTPSINFASYDDMHRVLAPSRLAIVKALAGQGPLAIREVARRVGRDVQAVHKDVTTLVIAGVIDRAAAGVDFPYDRIHFEFDVQAAA